VATSKPTSNRYALLTKCPTTPDCWIYVVRAGDNLFSIARYFGVPLATIEARNPWVKTTALAAGQKLLLPAPTR
ncbi:MAG TPA: LysM domain-containing protein, partial [Candidatus Polarisedimenticolia bacterium]|nr:LysM domain-containing protein [Candidatus Polarisedimenticolia bacterium]